MKIEKFDIWNEEKKIIHNKAYDNIFVNSKEIWFTKMWINLWFEENGKKEFRRPVLVLKKVWNLFFTVALTSKWKIENKFYHKFKTTIFNKNNQKYKYKSFCILSQVKIMDKKRFTEKMWYVWRNEFEVIKEKLKELLL